MPNSPKVGQTTLGMPVVTCPACQETYQPSIWHHRCPPVPVPEALPEQIARRITLARFVVAQLRAADFDETGIMRGAPDDYALVSLADRLDARERDLTEERNSNDACLDILNREITALTARAKQAERLLTDALPLLMYGDVSDVNRVNRIRGAIAAVLSSRGSADHA